MSSTISRPVEGDISVASKLEIGMTVTFVAAAIVVLLRVVARVVYSRLSWDDYTMIFATLCILAFVAVVVDFVAVHWGLGRHSYFLNPRQRVQQQFYSSLAQIFCIQALTFAKISICLTYIRVVSGAQKRSLRWLRWTCYTIAISVFVVNGSVSIITYAQCMPAEKSWNRAIPGTCWPILTFIGFVLLQGSFSVLTDFMLCVIPIFLLKDLQISVRSKVTLCVLMGLGLITGVFATIRTVKSGASVKGSAMDTPYDSIMSLTWAGMERNLAIMIGSIPTLRPLMKPTMEMTSRSVSKLKLIGSRRSSSTTNVCEVTESKGSMLPGVPTLHDDLDSVRSSHEQYRRKTNQRLEVRRADSSGLLAQFHSSETL